MFSYVNVYNNKYMLGIKINLYCIRDFMSLVGMLKLSFYSQVYLVVK